MGPKWEIRGFMNKIRTQTGRGRDSEVGAEGSISVVSPNMNRGCVRSDIR